MGRNRYIYTLADQALVIDSALRSGGTWEGAVENLSMAGCRCTCGHEVEGAGNAALVAEGALPCHPDARLTDTLIGLFGAQAVNQPLSGDETADAQQSLLAPGAGALAEAAPSESPPFSVQEELPPQPGPEALRASDRSHRFVGGSFVEDPHAVPRARRLMSNQRLSNLCRWSAAVSLWICMLTSAPSWHLCYAGVLCQKKKFRRCCASRSSRAKAWLKRASDTGLVEKLKKPSSVCFGKPRQLVLY